jgi:hypothetical protein
MVMEIALVGLVCGCQTMAEPVYLRGAPVEARLDYSNLGAVLKGAVKADGLLIPDALKKRCDVLDQQLALLQAVGPSSTPELLTTEDDRIAYWYNARASWAMKLSLVCDFPKRFARRDLADRQFTLDGRPMSLARIDKLLARFEDWRVLVGAPGVTLSRAKLPAVPFGGSTIRKRIPERLNEFIDDPQRFVIDVQRKRILVPLILWQFRQTLIDSHAETYGAEGAGFATALLPYLEGAALRRIQDAVGYRAVPARRRPLGAFVVEDWRIGL